MRLTNVPAGGGGTAGDQNLPAAHGALQRQRLSADGVDVRARVLPQRIVGGDAFLAFEVPADAPEPGDRAFRATVQVARSTYDAAGAADVRRRAGAVVVDNRVVRARPGHQPRRSGDHRGARPGPDRDGVLCARFGHRLRPQLVLIT